MSALAPDGQPHVAASEPANEGPSEPAWVPGREIVGADLAWAGLTALVAVVTCLLFRSALVPVDPWHYVQDALAFPQGTWRPAADTRLRGRQVWSDWATRRILGVYRLGPFGEPRWDAGQFASLNDLYEDPPTSPSGYPQPGDYVVLYSNSDQTCRWCRDAIRDVKEVFGALPQDEWEVAYTSSTGNLTLYRLGPDAVWPEAKTP